MSKGEFGTHNALDSRSQEGKPQRYIDVDSEAENLRFYEELKKLVETRHALHQQIRDLQAQKESLYEIVLQLEVSGGLCKERLLESPGQEREKSKENEENGKSKRMRRTNSMIEKKHVCPAERCGRNYGSEGSLQQHLKLKHPHLANNANNAKSEPKPEPQRRPAGQVGCAP